MRMGIVFDDIFSICREMSSREDTWVSPPSLNYIAEAINFGSHSHEYFFTYVELDYEYIRKPTVKFQCMYVSSK